MCEVGTNAEHGEATIAKATRTMAIMAIFAGGERQRVGVEDTLSMLLCNHLRISRLRLLALASPVISSCVALYHVM